jgi:predicted transglutaminase-like cysteine proteinase
MSFASAQSLAPPSDAELSQHGWQVPRFPLGSVIMHNRGGSAPLSAAIARHREQRSSGYDTFAFETIALWNGAVQLAREPLSSIALHKVNERINAVAYRDRNIPPGLPQEWQTPAEFFTAGGNCTGYALAKLLALQEAGLIASDALIVIGHLLDDQPHALVVVRLSNDVWYALDNRNSQIIPTTDLLDFVPWFAVSDKFTWMYKHDLAAISRLKSAQ